MINHILKGGQDLSRGKIIGIYSCILHYNFSNLRGKTSGNILIK